MQILKLDIILVGAERINLGCVFDKEKCIARVNALEKITINLCYRLMTELLKIVVSGSIESG